MFDPVMDPKTDNPAIPKTFQDYFSPEIKADPAWAKFEKTDKGDDLFKSYKSLESMLGQRVKLPDANSTLEDQHQFWEKLGKPKSAEEYPLEFDPSLNVDKAGAGQFKKVFYDANLTASQASSVLHALNSAAQQVNLSNSEQADRLRVESEVALKREWGANFDMNKALAKRAVGAVFGDSEMERIIGQMGNDQAFVKGMQKVGSMLNEKGLLGKSSPRELGGYSPDEAQRAYRDIINTKTNAEYEAYHNKRHPQHTQVVDKVMNLITASQRQIT